MCGCAVPLRINHDSLAVTVVIAGPELLWRTPNATEHQGASVCSTFDPEMEGHHTKPGARRGELKAETTEAEPEWAPPARRDTVQSFVRICNIGFDTTLNGWRWGVGPCACVRGGD